MNWQQRAGQIAANLREQGQLSIRDLAAVTGIAKSSVHRQLQARQRRASVSRITPVGTGKWLRVVTPIGVGSGVCVWRQTWDRERNPVRIFPSGSPALFELGFHNFSVA